MDEIAELGVPSFSGSVDITFLTTSKTKTKTKNIADDINILILHINRVRFTVSFKLHSQYWRKQGVISHCSFLWHDDFFHESSSMKAEADVVV